jgi:hypothetical protein
MTWLAAARFDAIARTAIGPLVIGFLSMTTTDPPLNPPPTVTRVPATNSWQSNPDRFASAKTPNFRRKAKKSQFYWTKRSMWRFQRLNFVHCANLLGDR